MDKKSKYFVYILAGIGWVGGIFLLVIVIQNFIKYPYGRYKPLTINQEISSTDGSLNPFFKEGWSDPEAAFRWTKEKEVKLQFELNNIPANCQTVIFQPHVMYVYQGSQNVNIRLNETDLGIHTIKEMDSTFSLKINKSLFNTGFANVLKIEIPNAGKVGDDPRTLGFSIKKFSFKCQ